MAHLIPGVETTFAPLGLLLFRETLTRGLRRLAIDDRPFGAGTARQTWKRTYLPRLRRLLQVIRQPLHAPLAIDAGQRALPFGKQLVAA